MYQKSSLTSVTIPNSVTGIGYCAFKGCTGLTTINYNAVNCNGGGFSYDYHWLDGCDNITTVNIGDSVQTIPPYFMLQKSGLTSVTIPNSVTTIGDDAFYYCTGLTSVTIPNSVTTIGVFAFGCTGLTSVTIPNSVTTIGDGAFYYSDLTSVTIGNSVTTIGESAFKGCTDLTSVTIGNSVTTIGSQAFYGCTGLTSVTIPNSVTTIGGRAFEGCTGLTSVTIGNSVTTIGVYAFKECTSLSVLQIGTSVNTIEDKAFYKCSGLNTIDCKAENPPVLGSAVFGSINKDNVTVIVPCEKSSLYQNATGWSLFNNIVENCESSIDVVEKNQILVYPNPAKENITLRADEDIFIYNNLGQIVKQINNPKGETTISISDLPRGIYYLKTGNKTQKLIKE